MAKKKAGYEIALERIEEARKTGAVDLGLSKLKLAEVPSEITQLTALTHLDLTWNQITTLPKEIGNLTSLTHLDLTWNQITTLSKEIGNLTSLAHLDLTWNQITTLPKEIGNLTSLIRLDLTSNQITTLPKEIGNLTSLTHLNLTSNQITTLPKEIGQLTSLVELALQKNRITQLPSEIGQLQNLKSLFMTGNPLEHPPMEIAEKGIEAIREYFQSHPVEKVQQPVAKPSKENQPRRATGHKSPSQSKPLSPVSTPSKKKTLEKYPNLQGNFSSYKVHFNQLLGKGGFCSVYKATDPNGRTVAMKIPNQALDDNKTWDTEDAFNAMFQEEAKNWSSLSKRKIPGVVELYHHGVKPHPWIAMELMEGGTLKERMGNMTLEEKLALMKVLLHTFSLVHFHGIVHRDIKPENILFTKGGEAKLGDFGVAKALLTVKTATVNQKLTLPYAAPEQLSPESFGETNWQTDIYQFGASCFELLTGRQVFPETDVARVMYRIVNEKPGSLVKLNSEIPSYVNRVILKCLAKQKKDRYLGMAVVLDHLERKEGRHPPSPPPQLRQPLDEAGESKRLLIELHKWLNLLKETGVDIGKGVKIYNTLREYHRLEWYDQVKKECVSQIQELKGHYEQAQKERRTQREALLKNVQKLFKTCIAEGLDVSAFYKENAEAMKDYRQGDLANAEKRFRALKGKLEHVIGEKKRREEEEEEKRRELEAFLHVATTPQNALQKQQAWAQKLGVDIVFTSPSGIEFILIPAGSFTRGSKEWSDATPHQVTLSKPFYLGKYQITQAQWKVVMGNTPSIFRGDTRPVEQVSWKDCQEFIQKLNAKERTNKYRLPTEAEWEYACRAGTTTKFSFGDDESKLSQYGWFDNNSGGETHPVGQKKPSIWSLYDMHGNVWEWCQDWHGAYPKNAVTDPSGPGSGSDRVDRGGGWGGTAGYCSASNRDRSPPGLRFYSLGFRLARSL